MKIFGFVKNVVFVGLTILSGFTNANFLSCISMSNQECKTRPQVINVNADEPVLIEECTETVEEVKLAKPTLAKNENSYKCTSCTVHTLLLWMFLTSIVGVIGAQFVYYNWSLIKNNVLCLKFGTCIQTTIY